MLILTTSFVAASDPAPSDAASELDTRAAAQGARFVDDLVRLRADALIVLGWITGSIGYLCLILLFWPITGTGATAVSWLGTVALLAASALAIWGSRRFQRVARYGFAAGVHFAAACGMVTLGRVSGEMVPQEMIVGEDLGSFLFLLPIIFASVLFNRWWALANALLAITLIMLINRFVLGISPWTATPLLTVVIIAITAVASWLAAHNLYSVLTWLSSAYADAHTNERLARERQAELQRVLKALDEAHYRLRRLNGLLVTARDQAEEGKRIKQYFAQTISHELRTPLNLVVGFVELMIGSPEYYGSALSSPYLRDLRIVYRNACHLQGLVNDVLDLARIESAQMTLILAQVAPAELTHEAVETVRSLVEARGLRLTTQIAEKLPPLWLDATRIRQVLINLLNNAARYTPRGAVCVRVEQVADSVQFAVSDSGIGISPTDLERIFDEFYQVDGGSNRSQEGAGLGLAISRKFVSLHGGRMWAESVQGEGSTFFFTLPLHPSLESSLTPTDGDANGDASAGGYAGVGEGAREPGEVVRAGKQAQAQASQTQRNQSLALGLDEQRVLLVVTDSNSAVGLLSRYLPHYRVLAASELAQAQTLARQVMPQALVVDSNCVDLDASALTEMGRGWGLLQTPIISCPLPGEVPLRRRLAVDSYLIKPVAQQSLWDTVRSFGESVEQILIVDDNRDFVRLLRQMLANPLRPYQIECAYSGEEALAKVRLAPPDLLLLDLGLPDLNGVHIIERLRGHRMWHSIPIVVISAQDELDGLEVLQGGITVTKAGGMLPGDLIRWLGAVMGTKM